MKGSTTEDTSSPSAEEIAEGLSDAERWHVPWYGLPPKERPLSPKCWPCSSRLLGLGVIQNGWSSCGPSLVLTDLGRAVANVLAKRGAR